MEDKQRLDSITEEAFNNAVSTTVDLIRTSHPELDLRKGTAVRALVVEPAATSAAAIRSDIENLRNSMSIAAMEEAGSVPVENASAVLSNFGIELRGGSKSTGLIRIIRTSPDDTSLSAGTEFVDGSGTRFVTTESASASIDAVGSERRIISLGTGLYYFTVEAEAVDAGSGGNIPTGTALSTSIVIGGLVMCDAFSDFSGGTDGESISSAVARIPAALAYRGLTNAFSTQAVLSDAFSSAYGIRAVSCVGYRDRAMLRDKHNPLGVSVGGRVDVYVRTFDAPEVTTLVLDGTREEDNPTDEATYTISMPDSVRGFYAVKSVCRADYEDIRSSLDHELSRTMSGSTWHDISIEQDASEIAWSTWQDASLTVHDHLYFVTGDDGDITDGTESGELPREEHELPKFAKFKVEVYCSPGVPEMQTYLDSDNVRNVVADHVVRTPPICLVNVVATVKARPGSSPSSRSLEDAVAAYINTRSFTGRITRSEIANILLQHGAESTNLGSGGMYLSGRVCGADGKWYTLSGDSLDVSTIQPDRAMIDTKTVVFAAETEAIHITVV